MSNYNVKIICFKEKKQKFAKLQLSSKPIKNTLKWQKTRLMLKKNNYLYYFFNNLLTLVEKTVIIFPLLFVKVTKGSWETNN